VLALSVLGLRKALEPGGTPLPIRRLSPDLPGYAGRRDLEYGVEFNDLIGRLLFF
jgi:hypothetical protein